MFEMIIILIAVMGIPFGLYYAGKYLDIQIKKQKKLADNLMTPEEVIRVLKVQNQTDIEMLKKRIETLESIVTDSKYTLDEKIKQL